ncbi:MAG: hypothetical protein RJA49_163 [Actinomycetota bacterium]
MLGKAHDDHMIPEPQLHLSLQIAEHGIEQHHADVLRYVAELRREGRDGILLDLAADPSQPAVARERAFGRLLTWIAHTPASQACAECPAAA